MTTVPRAKAPVDERLSRLVVGRPMAAGPDRIAWAIRAARSWLGPEVTDAPPGLHRYQADLRLRVGESPSLVTFGKAAFVDIGPLRPSGGGWEVEIGWRASTLAPLFPVFSGHLIIGSEALRIEGLYAPPGGALGRLADRMLLHVAASGTARWLLDELDRAGLSAED